MSPYINPLLPITLEQAQQQVDERSNGGFEEKDGHLSPIGEWCLAELEGFSVKLRHQLQQPLVPPAERVVRIDSYQASPGHVSPHFLYSADEAFRIVNELNERLNGAAPSKGGRVWLDGPVSLEEIEALCVWARYLAGENAFGAIESVVGSYFMDLDDSAPNLSADRDTFYQLVRAGCNPAVFPRVFEKFVEHRILGWSYPRIVSAANQQVFRDAEGQIRNITIPSARHHDRIMAKIIEQLGAVRGNLPGEDPYINTEQGFIDQHCNFYTREEAWVIAVFHGQIVRDSDRWPARKLYSENLY